MKTCGIINKKSHAFAWPLNWLGWKDLNPRITESESAALPLGDTPENEILAADFVLTHSAFIL